MTEQHDVLAPVEQVPIGTALSGAVSASFCGALVTGVVSWLIWREPWWEAVLAIAALPFAVVWLGSLGYAVRVAVSWNVRPQPPAPVTDGENVRLIPVYHSAKMEGIDRADLAYFVKTALDTGDWTQRAWRTKPLPSGRKMDTELHGQMMAILDRYHVILDYGPRKTGKAAMTSAEALRLLGLSPALPDAEQSPESGYRVQSQQFSQGSGD